MVTLRTLSAKSKTTLWHKKARWHKCTTSSREFNALRSQSVRLLLYIICFATAHLHTHNLQSSLSPLKMYLKLIWQQVFHDEQWNCNIFCVKSIKIFHLLMSLGARGAGLGSMPFVLPSKRLPDPVKAWGLDTVEDTFSTKRTVIRF